MESLWAQWWRQSHAEHIVAHIELPPTLSSWDFLLTCHLQFEIYFTPAYACRKMCTAYTVWFVMPLREILAISMCNWCKIRPHWPTWMLFTIIYYLKCLILDRYMYYKIMNKWTKQPKVHDGWETSSLLVHTTVHRACGREQGSLLCLRALQRQLRVSPRHDLTQPAALRLISTSLTDESTRPLNTGAKQTFQPLTVCSVDSVSSLSFALLQ